jgi:hypothetical protein
MTDSGQFVDAKLFDKPAIGHRQAGLYESPALPLCDPGKAAVISVEVVVWLVLSVSGLT